MWLGFWVLGFICPSIDDLDYKESSATIIFYVLLFFFFGGGPVLIGMCMCFGDFDFCFYVKSSVTINNTFSFVTNSNLLLFFYMRVRM
jgi:hypothetical protein